MQTKFFSLEEIKDLEVAALARKYKCSEEYVRCLLKGSRARNTEMAKKIVEDAIAMHEVITRETVLQ